MSEFKGTPGPWRVGDKSGIWTPILHEGSGIGFCPPQLAKVTTRYSSSDQSLANANLIAAAPELLEALQLVMSEQSGGDKSCGHNGFTCTCPYDKAKAAISKALGQLPLQER